jgi:hypothetical protein
MVDGRARDGADLSVANSQKSGGLGAKLVIAGRQSGESVSTFTICFGRAFDADASSPDEDAGIGDHGAVRVDDDAFEINVIQIVN